MPERISTDQGTVTPLRKIACRWWSPGRAGESAVAKTVVGLTV